jgi:Ca2+-binding RTX toxin-like protein
MTLVAPAVSMADGAVTRTGNQVRFDSDSQDAENLVITRQSAMFECQPTPTPCVQFGNGPQKIRVSASSDAGCAVVTNSNDTVVACTTAVTSIVLNLNDGDDFARTGPNVPGTTMNGGSGADNLSSDNSAADAIFGGSGDDEIFDDASSGADVLDGGADDDAIATGGGNDNVNGGSGVDTVTLESGDDTVRLDDIANDGRVGETKNIHTDVEVVDGDGGSDNLFGNAAANTLIGGSGNDLIDGGGGPDVLEGGTGADDLAGGADVDRVVYPEPGAQTITLDGVRDDGVPGELDNVHSDIENVAAGPGNDVVVGNDAANTLDGGPGDDRLDGRAAIDAFIGAAGADTLLARDGLPERVDCGSESDTGEGDTIDQLLDCEGVLLSSALVPDVDGDGSTKPSDCDDGNPAVRPGAFDVPENGIDEDCSGADAVNLDRDGDGSLRPADCDDGDARIHPGAVDIPGNAVDEDCRGGAAPFPRLESTITTTFVFAPKFTAFNTLTIRRVRAGSTLRMTCRGRGCPFRSRTRRLTRSQSKLTIKRPLGRARLRPRARFEVRVTLPGTVGVVARYTVRAGKFPTHLDRCLNPGATRPTRCPT